MEDVELEVQTMYPGFVHHLPSTTVQQNSNVLTARLPFVGRVRLLTDCVGLLKSFFVVACYVYAVFTSLFVIVQPQYDDDNMSAPFVVLYISLCFNMFLSLIMSIITNPGQLYLTQALEPLLSDTSSKSYCKTCHMHRPPRSFHCSHCGHCVRRMDFHYSWLNNCVGEDNHHIFLLTIVYTLFFCITTLVLSILHFYYYPKCITCLKQTFYIKHSIWFIYTLNIILIYGFFQSLIMFVVQHLNIIMNRTTVENVLLTPVVDYTPYTKFESYADLFKTTNILLWPFPCKRQPFSSQFDGTTATTEVARIIATAASTTTTETTTTTTTTTPTLATSEASEEDHLHNGLI